ncbi:MAG: hypothetical protein IPK00_27420 [Deltaproteobacteria bacterium]|nr:hypothetical protein [Deltaproteobacteria bacterium]
MSRGPYSTEQMIALHAFFAEAAAAGEAALADLSGSETGVDVLEVRAGVLEEFGERGMRVGEDLVAAVMGRLEGGLPGSAGLALEPEEALAWARIGGEGDPIENFVALGGAVLEGLAQAISEVTRMRTLFQDGRLAEQTEPCLLAATHAPSDTRVLSARMRIETRGEAFSAVAHLLAEPKQIGRLLASLSAPVH